MATMEVTLVPSSDGSKDNIVQSPAWTRLDDDPAASDGTAANTLNKGSDAFLFLGLSDLDTGETTLPITFDSMDAVDVQWRCRWFTFTDDNAEFYVQMFEADESTPLSNEVLATQRTSIPSAGATGTATLTGVVAGTKAQWDTAMLRFRIVYIQNMGGDGGDFQVDALRVFGTYTSNSTVFERTLTGAISPVGSFEMELFDSWGIAGSDVLSMPGERGMFLTGRQREMVAIMNEGGSTTGIWNASSSVSGLNFKIDCAVRDWYSTNTNRTYLADGGTQRMWLDNGTITMEIHPAYDTVVATLPDDLLPWQRLTIFCEWYNLSSTSEVRIFIYDDWEESNPQLLVHMTGHQRIARQGSNVTRIPFLSPGSWQSSAQPCEPAIIFRARGENTGNGAGVQFDIEFSNPTWFPDETPREGVATEFKSSISGAVIHEQREITDHHWEDAPYRFPGTRPADHWPLIVPFANATRWTHSDFSQYVTFGRDTETRLDTTEHFSDLDVTRKFWSLSLSFEEIAPIDWAEFSGLEYGGAIGVQAYDERKAKLRGYFQGVEMFLIAKGYAYEPHVWVGIDNDGFPFFEVGNGTDSVRLTSNTKIAEGVHRTLIVERSPSGIALHESGVSLEADAHYEDFPLDSSRDWMVGGHSRNLALNTITYYRVDDYDNPGYTSTADRSGIMDPIHVVGPTTIAAVDFTIRPGFGFPSSDRWVLEIADASRTTLLASSELVTGLTNEYPEWNRLTLQSPLFLNDAFDDTQTIYICIRNLDSSTGQIAWTLDAPPKWGVDMYKADGNTFLITELGRQNGATVLTPETADEVTASFQDEHSLSVYMRIIGTTTGTDYPPTALMRWFAFFNDHVLDPPNRDNLFAYDGLTSEPVEVDRSTFYFNAADSSRSFINKHHELPNISDRESFPGVERAGGSAPMTAIGSLAGSLTNPDQEGVGFFESNIDVSGSWAISLFVSLDDVANGMQAIAISGSPINRDDAFIGVNSAGDWVGRIFDSSAGVIVGGVTGPKAKVGERLHLAYEWDSVTEEAIFYVNGKEYGRTSASGFVFTSGRHYLRVGRAAGGLDTPLLGDEVVYYDHAPGRSRHRHVALRGFGNGRLMANAETQAAVLEPVGNSLDVQWQILVPMNVDLEMAWGLGGAITVSLEVLWDVTTPVASSVEALWDLLVVIDAPVDLQALWDLETHVTRDLDTQWNVVENPRLPPDAILSQTNLSGVVEEIQDDTQGPDADWLEAVSDSTASDLLVSFPTPGSRLAYGYGGDVQEVQTLVRRSRESGNAPQVRVSLLEDGVELGISTLVTLNSDDGEIVSIFFDAEDLTDPTGAGLELRVEGIPSADE